MKIGFIGTGVMGSSMVKHLLNAGYPVTVYNRTKEKAQAVIDAGAKWADTPKEVASQSDVVLTIVGYPTDVEEVFFGEEKRIFVQISDISHLDILANHENTRENALL